MLSLLILADGTINMMYTLHQQGDQEYRFAFFQDGLVLPVVLFFSVSFEGMGCESVLNLSATPDEDVSIICTVVDKTILLTLWGKLLYVSYTSDWPVFP